MNNFYWRAILRRAPNPSMSCGVHSPARQGDSRPLATKVKNGSLAIAQLRSSPLRFSPRDAVDQLNYLRSVSSNRPP